MAALNLGFLCSHGGTNMQAIVDACKGGRLDASPRIVISNNSDSTALARARNESVPAVHLSQVTHPGPGELDGAILETLRAHGVDLLILAGYMKRVGPKTLAAYRGRALNIHPSLLPKFGGKGMYGRRVHEAVLASGERLTGVTVHVVDEEYDHGPTVAQVQVPVMEDDSVESLGKRVLEREHELFVETLRKIAAGEIVLPV
jgi:phosphoribosylglycinamide formyltransferase-1